VLGDVKKRKHEVIQRVVESPSRLGYKLLSDLPFPFNSIGSAGTMLFRRINLAAGSTRKISWSRAAKIPQLIKPGDRQRRYAETRSMTVRAQSAFAFHASTSCKEMKRKTP